MNRKAFRGTTSAVSTFWRAAAQKMAGPRRSALLMHCLKGDHCMSFQRENMKMLKVRLWPCIDGCGCRSPGRVPQLRPRRRADVSGGIRTSLDQAGLERRLRESGSGQGVVTLSGHVAEDSDKSYKPIPSPSTLLIMLREPKSCRTRLPCNSPDSQGKARAINSDLDKGIESNLDAALIENKLHESVKYAVKNNVVTTAVDWRCRLSIEACAGPENVALLPFQTYSRVVKRVAG